MYFETESLQNNIGEDLDRRNRNFEKIEFDTTLMATNLVTNGDFSNGTTDWLVMSTVSSFVVTNQLAVFTASSQYGGIAQGVGASAVIGNKFYVSANIKADSSSVRLFHSGLTMEATFTLGNGLLTRYSYIGTAMGTTIYAGVRDWRTSNWSEVQLDNVTLIDLTATFGAGKEPTVEQMDEIMRKFPNSWFDGTKNLFRASETLKKQIAMDARTEFEMKNLGINTYPLSDTTGWGSNTGVSNITATSGVISGLMANGFFYTNVSNYISTPNAIGDKIYSCGKVYAVTKVDSGNIASVKLHNTVKPMVYDLWIALSGITTTTLVLSYVSFQFISSEYATAVGRTIKVKDAVHINLTKVFGAGKEPTLEEMDRLMARYPNSWFDGVKPIQTIETLYQEKANKVQEAWITPTLLNGWVDYGSAYQTAGYYKDTIGNVHLRGLIKGGTLNADVLVLPIGYRPSNLITYFTSVNPQVYARESGELRVSGSNALVTLDGITFNAER